MPTYKTEEQSLGDAPIQPEYREKMIDLAKYIDRYFNGETRGAARKTGFLLMVYPFGSGEGRANYISNGADRKDVVTLMREQIARFEGMPEAEGHG